MGGERRKRRSQVRLAALRAFVRLLIASHELLELGSTIVADVFKDGHRFVLLQIIRDAKETALNEETWRCVFDLDAAGPQLGKQVSLARLERCAKFSAG
jgi:hypothetical protein